MKFPTFPRHSTIAALVIVLLAPVTATAKPLVFGSSHSRTRVILLHGLNGTPATMLTDPYDKLTYALSRRYQVIVAHEPYDTLAIQSDGDQSLFGSNRRAHGYGYRLRWLSHFRQLVAWADHRYGPKRLVVAGISWGGMHAMLAACYDPQVLAFAVSSPVVNPDTLTEFSSDALSALNLNLNGCAHRLNGKHGFIGWGDADTRVGTVAVRSLLRKAPHIESCRYHGLGHTSNSQTDSNIVRALGSRALRGCDNANQK